MTPTSEGKRHPNASAVGGRSRSAGRAGEPAARRSRLLVPLLLALWPAAAAVAASFPAVRGAGGAVASPERVSTEAGLEILRQGGNAADAAVATALAMAVVHPQAGNLGGGGFAVVRIDGELATLDFREVAPSAAHREMYLDDSGQPIPEASIVGPLAAGVPGSGPGLWRLHQRFGRLPWREVVEPARRAAAEGFPMTRRLHDRLADKRDLLSRFPETAAVWLPDGSPPPVGSRMRLPELATTLAAMADSGVEAVISGPVADAVEAASRRHGGILTAEDLASYRPAWRSPVRFEAFGWEVASMDLPASGGIILGQTLQLAERLRWSELPRFGAGRAHLLAEVWRRAFADRSLMGDPASTRARAADLLAEGWLARRAAEIDVRRASDSAAIEPWPGAERDSAETNHASVVDRDGNLVSLTTTLNGWFGCGLWVKGAGFFLNNEMDDFAAAPGRPNQFGLVQGEANAVAPGRRMLSSMTPTLAWRGDEAIAIGSPGGSRIPTATAQVLLHLLVDGDPLQTAIGRPRVHHQWLPDRLYAEPDALAPETRAELERRGHLIEIAEALARVHAVRRLADGRFEAAGDPRGPAVGGVVEPEP